MAKTLSQADTESRRLIANWVTGAALVGWMPGSTFWLTAADTAMIHQVATIYEVSAFDMEHLTSTLTGAITSAIAGGIITEVIGFVPVVGWAIKSAAMAAKAKLIGDTIQGYFRERSPLKNKKKIEMEEDEE
jgi:outer membrane lipoprotein SlyB